MTTRTRTKESRINDDYLDRVREFPLVSIRSKTQLQSAQKVLDRLLMQQRLSRGEKLYLDALSDLIGTYEDDHSPVEPPPHAIMLKHLLEARRLTPADLQRESGVARSTIVEILAGRKKLSAGLGRKFAEYFQVDEAVFALEA